ncbi:MAG: ATP-binding protein [Gemmatimonadales bacterium]|nr:ATP-binding protein [Gemmatimonadales bacterium]MDZ4388327.1 ATP-binding protein [Gemmatimonadales bacterium]
MNPTTLFLILNVIGLLGFMSLAGAVILRHARRDIRRLAAAQALIDRQIESADALREELSRELHDDLLQRLYGLALDIEAGQLPGGVMAGRLHEIAVDIRRLAHALHPADLSMVGLDGALEGLVREWQARTTAVLKLEVILERPIPDAWVLTLFRWFQEALANAVKHAAAQHIVVRLEERGGRLCLEVADDGTGFGFRMASVGKGMGLSSLRNRLISLGGQTVVRTEVGRGTTVRGGIPWPD